MENVLSIVALFGTAVFAASGALVAAEKNFDLVGAVFLSIAAGLGGGTIVDIMTNSEVRWLSSSLAFWVALFSAVAVFETARFWRLPQKSLLWADAAGLALFAATSTQSLLHFNLDIGVTLFLSAIAAAGGGIIRDVLANRPPLVFSGEIYVTAVIAGSLILVLALEASVPASWALALGVTTTFLIRAAGILFGLRLWPGRIVNR